MSQPLTARPRVTLLLITFNQQDLVHEAIRGALSQTWSPLQIIVSDDASRDATWERIQAAVRGYAGPHELVVRRNAVNQGISAHVSQVASLATGELLVLAAGDDVSVPHRCERLVAHWLTHGRPDVVASDVADMDAAGALHGVIALPDLDGYRSLDDWLARRPRVIGSAQAWSRRLFDRFGPLLPDAPAEDQILLVRAILAGGGASSLHEPLVHYRRGGLSRKRRYDSTHALVEHMRQGYGRALTELAQLQKDADAAGQGAVMRRGLAPKLARETFIRDMFEASGPAARLRMAATRRGVRLGMRLRMLFYTTCPAVYAPLLGLKRLRRRP